MINCEPGIQDNMHYHENDHRIFMVLEGKCTVRTPYKEFVLKQHDTVMLESKQLINCNTGNGRLVLLGAGNAGANGVPRSRVPDVASHTPVQEPIVA